MPRTAILLITALAGLTGCVETQVTRLEAGPARAALTPDAVAIYQSEADVPRAFTPVALLDSSADTDLAGYGDIYASMRKKAAALGANGIVLGDRLEPSPLLRLAGEVLGGNTYRHGRATAILVED